MVQNTSFQDLKIQKLENNMLVIKSDETRKPKFELEMRKRKQTQVAGQHLLGNIETLMLTRKFQ